MSKYFLIRHSCGALECYAPTIHTTCARCGRKMKLEGMKIINEYDDADMASYVLREMKLREPVIIAKGANYINVKIMGKNGETGMIRG